MKNRLALAIAAALFAFPSLACAAPQATTPPDENGKNKLSSNTTPTDSQNDAAPYLMDRIEVIGQRLFPYQEGISIGERYIRLQPKGNGDISTLLRINPSVQFNERAQTSYNMGEIRPAEISINGGLFYQNSFSLDGALFSNDLDPGSHAPGNVTDISSDSQGIAVDTELLESLTVYDSNVPASFGGFNGGVVEAVTRRAGDGFSGKISWRASRSVWNEYHVVEGIRESFLNSDSQSQQPIYDKQRLSLTLENRFANGLGLMFNVSQLESKIPLQGYNYANFTVDPALDDAIKKNKRQNTSYSLRADWKSPAGLDWRFSLTHAPTDETYFIVNTRNGYFDLVKGGQTASLQLGHGQGRWRFSHVLSHSEMDASRDSRGITTWHTWAYSEDKNWGNPTRSGQSLEGNWGSIEQRNRNTGYKLSLEREVLRWGDSEHHLQFGLSASRRSGTYHRLHDHYTYFQVAATTTCTDANGVVDTVSCSLGATLRFNGQGQYMTRMLLRRAGYFEAEMDELSAFMQDDIRWRGWSFRPGLRIDHDSLSRQTTWSPRLAVSWDVFGNQASLLTGGINRYYGRNLFAYKLREGREALTTQYERSNTGANALLWQEVSQAINLNRFQDIDVPYSDEFTLGLNQQWRGWDFNLKVVDRQNHDEVMRVRLPEYTTARVYRYANVGESAARTWTLSISPRKPLLWRDIATSLMLALDKTDVRRHFSSSSDDFDSSYSDAYNSIVRYRGKLIPYSEIPASDFNRPWTARLSSQTVFADSGFSMGHFLRYRGGYRSVGIVDTETLGNEVINVYDVQDFPRSFSWDANLRYEADIDPHFKPYVQLEINNLLNRANHINGTGNATVYEPGRSYWLEVGFRF